MNLSRRAALRFALNVSGPGSIESGSSGSILRVKQS